MKKELIKAHYVDVIFPFLKSYVSVRNTSNLTFMKNNNKIKHIIYVEI